MSTDSMPTIVAADWMPKDQVLFLGPQPDRRQFTDDESFYREWARRSIVITNIGGSDNVP